MTTRRRFLGFLLAVPFFIYYHVPRRARSHRDVGVGLVFYKGWILKEADLPGSGKNAI